MTTQPMPYSQAVAVAIDRLDAGLQHFTGPDNRLPERIQEMRAARRTLAGLLKQLSPLPPEPAAPRGQPGMTQR